MEGHCMCGRITVKVEDAELFSGMRRGHLCHCNNCRRVAGGIFGTNLAIRASSVEIRGQSNIKAYVDNDTSSGTPMERCFCMTCGTPILSTSPIMGDKIVIKLGVFPKVPEPEWEAFAVRRQKWEKPLQGCTQYALVGGPGKEQLAS